MKKMLSILNVRANHHNSCEDSFHVEENESHVWGIVADGCSSGIKSHFASQLIAYFIQNEADPRCTSDYTIRRLKEFLYNMRLTLQFSEMNLLSTCLLFTYNKSNKELIVRALGDGVYYVDDVEYIIDQNNTPDYIAYHIKDNEYQFENYLDKYPPVVYQGVNRFMICSDGIKSISISQLAPNPKNSTDLLFIPPTSSNYLTRMWNILKKDHYILNDDLTIVSYVS